MSNVARVGRLRRARDAARTESIEAIGLSARALKGWRLDLLRNLSDALYDDLCAEILANDPSIGPWPAVDAERARVAEPIAKIRELVAELRSGK